MGLAKYDVESVVGEGAYGVVLKCRHRESGAICAIKKFKDETQRRGGERGHSVKQTATRELQLLRLLSAEEHIITLREAFRRKGTLYLVFDFAERNMLQLLEALPDGVPEWQARHYSTQLLQALGWCHANRVVHRDIKPENLLVNADLSLCLCDFGFARLVPDSGVANLAEQEPLTDYVATRWYRAPELLLGTSAYGPPVDVWAAGCILGELVTGRAMFPGDSELDQLYLVQRAIGPISPAQQDAFLANDRFAGYKFPDMSRPEGLEPRTAWRLPRSGGHALARMLTLDPERRASAAETLALPYFAQPHPAPPPVIPIAPVPPTPGPPAVALPGAHEQGDGYLSDGLSDGCRREGAEEDLGFGTA